MLLSKWSNNKQISHICHIQPLIAKKRPWDSMLKILNKIKSHWVRHRTSIPGWPNHSKPYHTKLHFVWYILVLEKWTKSLRSLKLHKYLLFGSFWFFLELFGSIWFNLIQFDTLEQLYVSESIAVLELTKNVDVCFQSIS